jgi:tripeptide aminopeptidase
VCAAAAVLAPEARPTVHAAFTCCEESGKMGAGLLAPGLLDTVDCAFSVDGAKPVGTVITRALGQTSFAFVVHGRAAHAAANPEAGVNAIAVAAEIINALPLGRQPGGGSVNVAAILGGSALDRLTPEALSNAGGAEAAFHTALTNSIPDRALVRGEVRGYTVQEIETTIDAITDTVARVCEAGGARYEWIRDRDRMVPPFPHAEHSRARALVQSAAHAEGIPVVLEERQATLEANYLAANTDVVALASGGRDPHQHTESIPAAELQRLGALLVAILTADPAPA